jgi:predicted transcriptional regulator
MRVAAYYNFDYISDSLSSYKGDNMLRNRLEQTETLTFRIAPELKAAFAEIAEAEAKPIGELLRELVRQRVAEQRRREFEAEARRQSLEAAAAARNPESDEAAIMRELDAHLAEGIDGWK